MLFIVTLIIGIIKIIGPGKTNDDQLSYSVVDSNYDYDEDDDVDI